MGKSSMLTSVVAMAILFVLTSLSQATDTATGRQWAKKNLRNKIRATSIPVWQITQNGTAKSVVWADHAPNPRFAIYDSGTPTDETDDLVLDKETGLVWERSPAHPTQVWHNAVVTGYNTAVAGRKGWRLPAIEEFMSLVDPTNMGPSLPNGHPFIVNDQVGYWASTTNDGDPGAAWFFWPDTGSALSTVKTDSYFVWLVRGGQGHDGW
jgi:hypothetical protein